MIVNCLKSFMVNARPQMPGFFRADFCEKVAIHSLDYIEEMTHT